MDSNRLELSAPAKINLYLRVTGRRDDGYHCLATLMQKVSLFDRIVLLKIPGLIRLRCPDSNLPEDEGNLVYRAARLFFQFMGARLQVGAGVDITLYKTIPVAAGLGGGSSDAAAVLRGLDMLYSTGCSTEELIEMGSRLGADVPLFVVDWPVAWATGIGDRLSRAKPLAGFLVLLVNPGFSVPTAWVYKNFALTADQKIFNLSDSYQENSGNGDWVDFTVRSILPEELVNDLESVTARHYRDIDILKQRLLKGGAVAVLMSGSGPSVFGLFPENEAEMAAACCRELKREFQNTFLVKPLMS